MRLVRPEPVGLSPPRGSRSGPPSTLSGARQASHLSAPVASQEQPRFPAGPPSCSQASRPCKALPPVQGLRCAGGFAGSPRLASGAYQASPPRPRSGVQSTMSFRRGAGLPGPAWSRSRRPTQGPNLSAPPEGILARRRLCAPGRLPVAQRRASASLAGSAARQPPASRGALPRPLGPATPQGLPPVLVRRPRRPELSTLLRGSFGLSARPKAPPSPRRPSRRRATRLVRCVPWVTSPRSFGRSRPHASACSVALPAPRRPPTVHTPTCVGTPPGVGGLTVCAAPRLLDRPAGALRCVGDFTGVTAHGPPVGRGPSGVASGAPPPPTYRRRNLLRVYHFRWRDSRPRWTCRAKPSPRRLSFLPASPSAGLRHGAAPASTGRWLHRSNLRWPGIPPLARATAPAAPVGAGGPYVPFQPLDGPRAAS